MTMDDIKAIVEPHNAKIVAEYRLAEVERELEYAYRCIRDGFNSGNFDFTVLRKRANVWLDSRATTSADRTGADHG